MFTLKEDSTDVIGVYPSRDVASRIGNLVALPLQGQALKNGDSVFVDKNWNAYAD